MYSFKKYISLVQSLARFRDAGSLVASRHFQQLEKSVKEYFSSAQNDSQNKTFFDFSLIRIKISEIEHYLSSFSKEDLKNPPKRITFSQKPSYPPLSPEDLQE